MKLSRVLCLKKSRQTLRWARGPCQTLSHRFLHVVEHASPSVAMVTSVAPTLSCKCAKEWFIHRPLKVLDIKVGVKSVPVWCLAGSRGGRFQQYVNIWVSIIHRQLTVRFYGCHHAAPCIFQNTEALRHKHRTVAGFVPRMGLKHWKQKACCVVQQCFLPQPGDKGDNCVNGTHLWLKD